MILWNLLAEFVLSGQLLPMAMKAGDLGGFTLKYALLSLAFIKGKYLVITKKSNTKQRYRQQCPDLRLTIDGEYVGKESKYDRLKRYRATRRQASVFQQSMVG